MSPALRKTAPKRIDVEFSLALNNRTGKYFVFRDMLASQRDWVGRLRFWRLVLGRVPGGVSARVLGRLMTREVEFRAKRPRLARLLLRLRPASAVLFTDPFQVLFYDLGPDDVVVVHDMGPVASPTFYAPLVEAIYLQAFKEIVEKRPHVVFVSEASRDAFVQRYGAAFRTGSVIYNPIRVEALDGEERAPAGVTPPYLLCVGAVGARKNQAGALRGFRASGLNARGCQFVICGGPEHGHDEVVAEAQGVAGARLVGYAAEAELRWLYRHASGFVLLSRLEGFGVPAAEAIQRGLVPLLSQDPALKEVAGDAAVYVDATDDRSVAEGMLAVFEMGEDEREERLARARRHLERFGADRVEAAWDEFFERLAAGKAAGAP